MTSLSGISFFEVSLTASNSRRFHHPYFLYIITQTEKVKERSGRSFKIKGELVDKRTPPLGEREIEDRNPVENLTSVLDA